MSVLFDDTFEIKRLDELPEGDTCLRAYCDAEVRDVHLTFNCNPVADHIRVGAAFRFVLGVPNAKVMPGDTKIFQHMNSISQRLGVRFENVRLGKVCYRGQSEPVEEYDVRKVLHAKFFNFAIELEGAASIIPDVQMDQFMYMLTKKVR